MNNFNNVPHPMECKCFTWKPIVAGALVAIGLSFLLNLFSVAISLTAFTTNDQGVQNLALGGLIATAIGIIASMFASGWLSGYLAGRYCTKRHLGALYGFLTWCVALVITIFLFVHAQEYITLYSHFISGTPSMPAATGSNIEQQLSMHAHQANQVMVGAYIVFGLFFLGAFSCSLGGYCGMGCAERECTPHI